MKKWIVPAIIAVVLIEGVEYYGLQEQAWWLLPCILLPVVLLLMIVRKEITAASVSMALIITGVLAMVLKLTTWLDGDPGY